MADGPAGLIILDQQIPGDRADASFITLQRSSVHPDNEISEAKQLLQNVVSNLNAIENTLCEAAEQNITPFESTCDAVNTADEDVQKVIALLEKIEYQSKRQEIDIINLHTSIYNLNNRIGADQQEIKKLKEANRKLEKKVDALQKRFDALEKNYLGLMYRRMQPMPSQHSE